MSDIGPVDVIKSKCECVDCVLPPGHAPHAYPLVIFCPRCGMQHIDEAEFATKLHRVHRCVDRVVLGAVGELAAGEAPPYTTLPGCGYEWQPALVYTVGVETIL